MPAKDVFHEVVKNALIKDGWLITHEPLTVRFGKIDLHVDLDAERIIAACKENRKIAVEIKSFTSPSFTFDFHLALGQFMNYRLALETEKPEYVLYMAVPVDTYEAFFGTELVQAAVERYHIQLIVYQVKDEVIVRWKD